MALPTLTELGAGHGFTAGDLDTDGYVALCPAWQKIYFADGRPCNAAIGSSGYHKLDFINTKLVGAASGAFTKGEVVEQAVSGAKGVFDESVGNNHFIYRTTTTQFDTTNIVTGADSGETVIPTSVVAPPHWLNWTLTVGEFPDGGSNIMALAFNRIFMNSMFNPHQWFATRAGDPLDMQMSQADVGTAISSQTSKAGLVADELVALIPYKEHYLLFCGVDRIWVLRSDPAAGGVFTLIADKTGIFSSTSFCWDDKNNLYFLGSDGIYALSADAIINAKPPTNLTKEHIPKLVSSMGLNRRTDRVSMEYDKDRYGISVSVSQMDGVWSTVFWIDLRRGGVFPEVYQDDHVAASMLYLNSRRKDYRKLLWGGQDGYIRCFDETEKSDDGSNVIDSYVTIGPFSDIENPRTKIKMSELSIVTGLNTDSLEVGLYLAKTAQELIQDVIDGNTAKIVRTFMGDKLLSSIRQKISGGAIGIKLGNSTADESWSIEKITTDIKQSGRIK